jgi:hypothetical protein
LFDQFRSLLLGKRSNILGDVIRLDDLIALDTLIIDSLHPHEVDHTFQIALCSNRDLKGGSVHLEFGPKLTNNSEWVRTGSIHFVDES